MVETSPILHGFLSEEQLAQQLDVSVRTLKRWRTLRQGPPWTSVGRSVYYGQQGAREWILSRERKPVRGAA